MWGSHLHFFLAGYLFASSIAGPDPAPHRPSVPARLVVLGVAVAGHAVLAQLVYAGVLPHVQAPAHDLRAGADLMYYAGDIAELLLALAMVSTWRPHPRERAGRVPGPRPRLGRDHGAVAEPLPSQGWGGAEAVHHARSAPSTPGTARPCGAECTRVHRRAPSGR